MGPSDFKKRFVCVYSVFIMMTAGFVGMIGFEGVVDEVEVEAATSTVGQVASGAQYNSIQYAIDNASSGDTIYVWAGTYYENVIVNKTVTLIGNGTMNTTINGGANGDVMTIVVDWVNISGFKITNSGNLGAPNFDSGIELDYVENVTIMDVNCSNDRFGIYLWCSDSNDLVNITGSGNYHGVFLYSSSSNTIENSIYNSNQNYGIYLRFSSLNNIVNNTCISNFFHGIFLYDSDSNEVDNNTCLNNFNGIYIWNSDLNNVANNNYSNNWHGIYLVSATYNIINNNTCNSNNKNGVWLGVSSSNTIENNTCNSNDEDGINIDDSFSNLVKTNYFSDNGNGTHVLLNSCNNIISGNNILNSSNNGFLIESTCNNNHIFYNNIVFNSQQASDNGNNFWNNSQQEGNYWSDYTGLDNGAAGRTIGDGIGDTNIPHLGLDNYPLMEPWGFPESDLNVVYIDDDFTSLTPGWNVTHFNNIQDGIDNVNTGGTVYIWAGTYFENVMANKTVTLIGNGSSATKIDGGGNGNVVYVNADYVNITRFSIENSSSNSDNAGIMVYNSDNTKISHNNCSFNSNGITLSTASNFNHVFNNTCNNNSINGIKVRTHQSFVSNNTCSFNGESGIYFYSSSSIQDIIDNNTCDSNEENGIYVYNGDNDVIENNYCTYNSFGILLEYCSYLSLDSNNLSHSNSYGLFLESAENNTFTNNIFHMNSFSIKLDDFSNCNSFVSNTFQFGGGVLLVRSSFNLINMNQFLSDGMGIRFAYSPHNIFTNNNLINCGLHILGHQLRYWNTHTIDMSNMVNNKPLCYWKDTTGGTIPSNAGQVILANCMGVTIRNQDVSATSGGILLGYSSNNIISNVTSNSIGGWGIEVVFSDWNTIEYSNFDNNIGGIGLFTSMNNTIEDNTCKSSGAYAGIFIQFSWYNKIISNKCNLGVNCDGISLYSSSINSIENNICDSNDRYGLQLYASSRNTIFDNTFRNNDYGILMYSSASANNRIYHNNFISNNIQANTGGINYWDNGQQEGNHWSDYAGLDNGNNGRVAGDGIGDTEIPHLGFDEYPFIEMMGWKIPEAPTLYELGEYDSDGNYEIGWSQLNEATYYILEESNSSDFSSSNELYNGSNQNYMITGRTNGIYYYRLKGYNEYYEGSWSNTVDIIVDWPPNIPKDLQVEVYGKGNTLNLTWKQNAIDTKEYDIFYKAEVDWQFLVTMVHPSHSFNHSGLQDGLNHSYKIRARDFREQESQFSTTVSATPMDNIAPSSPKGGTIENITHNAIRITWDGNDEDDLEGYNIYRRKENYSIDWGTPINGEELITMVMYEDENLVEQTEYFYVITAVDEVPNESDYSEMISGITPLGPHKPEINNSLADFEIFEDTYDNSTINLSHWFRDLNNDPLEFRCEGKKNIDVIIHQINGSVSLKPKMNWNGEETLTFIVSDKTGNVSDNVTVKVKEVNDSPLNTQITEPINNTEIEEGTTLNFQGSAEDADTPYGDVLSYYWYSNISKKLGSGHSLREVMLPEGLHLITMVVIDSKGASISTSITVTVTPNSTFKDDTNTEDTTDNGNSSQINDEDSPNKKGKENYTTSLIAILAITIIIILAIFGYFKFLKPKAPPTLSTQPQSPIQHPNISPPITSQPQPNVQTKIPTQVQISQPMNSLSTYHEEGSPQKEEISLKDTTGLFIGEPEGQSENESPTPDEDDLMLF